MINFDALTLKAFIRENYDYLKNASVRKIQQPSRREVVMHLRNNGENRKLYININPEFFHICFLQDIQLRNITIPDAAPMFCMLLRKYIMNSKIIDIMQPFGERILELYFNYSDALGEMTSLCLAIELMGKYSNIVLYNKKNSVILGCAHNVGEEKSKYRELAGTLPYIYPAKLDKRDILNDSAEIFSEKFSGNFDEISFAYAVSSEYHYLTVPLVRQALKACKTDNFCRDNLKILYEKLAKTVSLIDIQPSINEDFSQFSLLSNLGYSRQNSVNNMIDKYFGYNQLKNILRQKKSKLYSYIDSQSGKYTKQINLLKNKLLEAEKADMYKLKADLLMMNTNAAVLPKINILSPYDINTSIEIELDERLSIIQNANRYYKLYKKTKTAVEYASAQIEDIENKLFQLDEQRFYIDIASSLEEIEEIASETGFKQDESVKKNKKIQINLESYNIDGFRVYLGKNSLQNDYLLSKIASPDDLWFHPLNMHGAHVILKKNNNMKVPDEVILACAKLTKRFAKTANNEAKIPVIYTERKYVKKAKSKIAFVTYKNETEIYC